MGLDQTISYYFKREVPTKSEEERHETEIKLYFRKFNALQGYMEDIFNIDNTETITLSRNDLFDIKTITQTILENPDDLEYIEENFSPTEGFFYGSTEIDDDYYHNIEKLDTFLQEAINHPQLQYAEYYCWY